MPGGDGFGLDLTLANPAVTVAGGRGRLVADVSGRTPDGGSQQAAGVELAAFEAAGLKPEGGLLKATELPLTLTEAGAKAFGNLYPAGTVMDPLSFAVALDPAAVLPPLPDIGSAPPATPGPGGGAMPSAAPVAASPADGFPTAAVAGALLVAALAVAGGLFARHRRRSAPADRAAVPPDASAGDTPADPA